MGTTPAPPDRSAIALGPNAAELRRRLGPVAWVVLEALVESARDEGVLTVSDQSVRGVAEALGLAKDTVARALQRLAAEHLVTRSSKRDGAGRFGAGSYVVDLPTGLIVPAPTSTRVAPSPRTRPARGPSRPSTVVQLSLIDLDGSPP
jgi:hypothetical protein